MNRSLEEVEGSDGRCIRVLMMHFPYLDWGILIEILIRTAFKVYKCKLKVKMFYYFHACSGSLIGLRIVVSVSGLSCHTFTLPSKGS